MGAAGRDAHTRATACASRDGRTSTSSTVDGKTLMSSRRHGSEDALAALACPHLRSPEEPHVLVGGLGMGFTLQATLDLLAAGRHSDGRRAVAGSRRVESRSAWSAGRLPHQGPARPDRDRRRGRGAAGVGTGTIRWHPPRRRQRAYGVHGVRQPRVIRQRRGERRVRRSRRAVCWPCGRPATIGSSNSASASTGSMCRSTGCVPD